MLNFTPFSPQFRGIQLLVATILSRRYNSRTGSGETKVESHTSSIHNPTLTQRASWQPWLACTAPGPPQESLVRDETRISLPAKPSLTQTMLCQLCVAPRTTQSRPVTTEPGREPRVSGGTAGAAVQCP